MAQALKHKRTPVSPLGWLAGDNKPNALGYTAIDPARWQALTAWYRSPEARREREQRSVTWHKH